MATALRTTVVDTTHFHTVAYSKLELGDLSALMEWEKHKNNSSVFCLIVGR